uniref:Uncharacterized protein n=1 Tax=Anguilla anguilla TaxID=7936 RepID=A0A0E9V4A8_ANGAN
MLFLLFLLL